MSAADVILHELQNFKAEHRVPLVVCVLVAKKMVDDIENSAGLH